MATLQNRQWLGIDEIINQYIDISRQSNDAYFRLWQSAFRGMEDMGMNSFYLVKSIKIPVNENLTAPLPADYLQYSKVGVLNMQGEIITMGVNNKLTVAFDLNPTRLTQTTDDTIQTEWQENGIWWYNYWNGYGMGNVYGFPSGTPFVGSFKIDNANGVIVLSQNFIYPYVMLEYVASPVPGENYVIPMQFREALLNWLSWEDVKYIPAKTHVNNSNVMMRRKDYYNALEHAKAKYDPVNLPDLYEWHLQNQRLTAKV